ncbi:MAG: serine hydrolase [bacterium]
MNDELNQQKKYQGNYDNDYKDSIKAISDIADNNLLKYSPVEDPKYMNLGAPRERDEQDVTHHKNNMDALCKNCSVADLATLGFTAKKNDEYVFAKKKTGPIAGFFAKYFNLYFHGPHFKLTKTSGLNSHGTFAKIKWGAVIVILAVSVSSFLTQSVLYLKDFFVGNSAIAVNINNSNNVAGMSAATKSGEARGSDDGTDVNGSSTSQKIGNASAYRLNDVAHFPSLSAKSFLVADLVTGETIKESQDVGVYPLASVSKLMTGVITYQQMDPKSMATVSRSSYNTFGTEGELLLGESIRVSDLMYPLLMESSNDGAEVLADSFGHDKFMSEMNKKAISLGMADTYYNDPSGLDPKNVSTVDDQFKLAKYIYENTPVIFDLTRVRQFEILNHRWYSKNAMLKMDSFLGGKNGFIDESKQTTTCLFDVQMAKGGKRKVAIILLRTSDREGDVVKILNFLKKNGYYNIAPEPIAK